MSTTKYRSLRNRLFLLSVIVSGLGYCFGILFCRTDSVRAGLLCGQVVSFVTDNEIIGALCVGPVAVFLVFLFGFSFLGAGGTVTVLYYYSFSAASYACCVLTQKGIYGIFSVILKLFPTTVVITVLLCLLATDSLEYSFTCRTKSEKEFIHDTFSYIQSSLYLFSVSFVAFIWVWKIIPVLDGYL